MIISHLIFVLLSFFATVFAADASDCHITAKRHRAAHKLIDNPGVLDSYLDSICKASGKECGDVSGLKNAMTKIGQKWTTCVIEDPENAVPAKNGTALSAGVPLLGDDYSCGDKCNLLGALNCIAKCADGISECASVFDDPFSIPGCIMAASDCISSLTDDGCCECGCQYHVYGCNVCNDI